ncbi:hypothetical protein ACFYP4_02355 [Streptomyces sp. NPDC005551]|uniref:hypothetical protein n=1 Tax=Streptomyces sp. NPDC005551 TaxID=3364725 RepID=UPI0036997FDE
MSETTFPERVEEDRIFGRFIYHGEVAESYKDDLGRVRSVPADKWTVVLFRPDNTTWRDGRLQDGACRLGSPKGEIGHTIVLEWESGVGNRKAKNKHHHPEPVQPDIAEVLSMYCQDAHGVENNATFEHWYDDRRSEPDAVPTLKDYRTWQSLCRYCDELKRFLGTEFDEYINHTEFM